MKSIDRTRVLELVIFGWTLLNISLSALLWISDRAYPLTPLFFHAIVVPAPFDSLLVISLIFFSLIAIVLPENPKPILLFLLNFGFLLFLDQSRLRPWTLLVFFFVIGFYLIRRRNNPARHASIHQLFRLLFIGVLLWSALQKLHVSFITEIAPHLFQYLPIIGDVISTSLLFIFALPLIEMSFIVGLIYARTRNITLIGFALFHGFLLLALASSPETQLPLYWSWQILLPLLAFVLFWNTNETLHVPSLTSSSHPYILSILLFFFLLPALHFLGIWDSSPSFALRSGKTKSATLILRPEYLTSFPEHLWKYAKRQRDGSVQISFSDWSRQTTHTSAYPETRIFRSGLLWICTKTQDKEIYMEIYGRPNWITKNRTLLKLSCRDL